MLIIAITGGIASGKTTVANIFAKKYHIPIIDSDEIARDIIQPGSNSLNSIVKKFGIEILNQDNTLNRKKLRNLIFNNKNHKEWLEKLLHPEINSQIKKQINILKQNKTYKYCLVMIPLLTKAYLVNNNFIDKVLVVTCNKDNQLQRASIRDNQPVNEIKKIIAEQLTDNERLELADYVINNNSNIEQLDINIQNLHNLFILI